MLPRQLCGAVARAGVDGAGGAALGIGNVGSVERGCATLVLAQRKMTAAAKVNGRRADIERVSDAAGRGVTARGGANVSADRVDALG